MSPSIRKATADDAGARAVLAGALLPLFPGRAFFSHLCLIFRWVVTVVLEVLPVERLKVPQLERGTQE